VLTDGCEETQAQSTVPRREYVQC